MSSKMNLIWNRNSISHLLIEDLIGLQLIAILIEVDESQVTQEVQLAREAQWVQEALLVKEALTR